ELRRFGVEGGAVAEGHSLAEAEGVLGGVLRYLPRGGEEGDDLTGGVDTHQPLVDVAHQRLRDRGAAAGGEGEGGRRGRVPDHGGALAGDAADVGGGGAGGAGGEREAQSEGRGEQGGGPPPAEEHG